jgi:predicted O-methyltransferase YrrM
MPYNLDIPGFMSVRDLEVLEHLAQRVPENGIIVEVGSFMGRSSWALAKSCDKTVNVICVDAWPPYTFNNEDLKKLSAYQEGMEFDISHFRKNISDCPNIEVMEGCSTEIPWEKERLIDLIFIDGDHESPGVNNDLECWFERLKPDGIFSGHDFNVGVFPDVCKAVIEKSEKENLPFKLFEKSAIWVIEKESEKYRNQGWAPNEETVEEIKEMLERS